MSRLIHYCPLDGKRVAGRGYCNTHYRRLMKSGDPQETRKHGLVDTTEYRSWMAMKQRCYNEKHMHFDRYGGRGITVCDRWRGSFKDFLKDMGNKPSAKHTIERIDNDGNYEPSNCRWATYIDQGKNKNSTVLISHSGFTGILKDHANRLGIPYGTLYSRKYMGWSVDRMFNEPVRTQKG